MRKQSKKEIFIHYFICWPVIMLNGLAMALAFGFARYSPWTLYALLSVLAIVFSVQLWIRFNTYNELFI